MTSLKKILLIISGIEYNTFSSDSFLSGMWLINFNLTFLLSLKPFWINSKNPSQFFSIYQQRSGLSLTDGEVNRNAKLSIIPFKRTTDIKSVINSSKELAGKHFTLIKICSQYYVINEYCPRRRVRYFYAGNLEENIMELKVGYGGPFKLSEEGMFKWYHKDAKKIKRGLVYRHMLSHFWTTDVDTEEIYTIDVKDRMSSTHWLVKHKILDKQRKLEFIPIQQVYLDKLVDKQKGYWTIKLLKSKQILGKKDLDKICKRIELEKKNKK